MTDMMGQFVWLRRGVTMPDWSLVTADGARWALAAMAEVEGLLARLANIEPLEDEVWRAVLEEYAETGRAPAVSEVAARTGFGPEIMQSALRQLQARDVVVLDELGEAITGAYPFTERITPHRVRLNRHRLNAMCAIDALGVGAMYGEDVEIESACHACGRPIVIEMRDHGHDLATAVPDGTVVWVGLHYADKCAATSLCQVLAFFCSDEHLQSWRRVNPKGDEGMRLTLAEAIRVAKAHFMPLLAPATHLSGQ